MALTNVAGVFSRFFIVGFFLPSFFALIVLTNVVDKAFLPTIYNNASSTGQVAIVGGAALFCGLVLLGLHYPVLRLYEGYPFKNAKRPPLTWLAKLLLWRQRHRLDRATEAISGTDADRFRASWRRDLRFPLGPPKAPSRLPVSDETLLLPTTFGNALRAFEQHPMTRWHLSSIGAHPHVEMLMSPQEAQVHSDARGDVAFFVNTSLAAALATIVLAANFVWHGDERWWAAVLACAGAAAVSAAACKASIGAVIRWGSAVRASFDLHRREIYEKLGVRAPRDFSDEYLIAWHVNQLLILGERLPDEYAKAPAVDHGPAAPVATDGSGSQSPAGWQFTITRRSPR